MSSTDLWELVHRCTGCRLKWIVVTGDKKRDRECPFCASPLVKARAVDRG